MKILYIITQADGGGAQKYVLDLAQHFGGEIAAGSEKNELFETAENLNIKTYKIKFLVRKIHPYFDVKAFFELTQLIRKVKPDIVHLNSTKAGILGSFAAYFAGVKIVFTAHGLFYLNSNSPVYKFFYILLERFASKFRDQIIAVSEHDKNNALKYKLVPERKITTIYNGIPPINFLSSEQVRKEFGLNKNDFVIGTIAQYYHRKGYDLLFDALTLLPREIRDHIRAVCMGDGPIQDELQKLIYSTGLEKTVMLTGYRSHAAQYLKGFNAFILPSRVEGFPYVLIEALEAKLPIIATEVGGSSEVVGNAGVMIPPENSKALAEALLKIIFDPVFKTSLTQKAEERSGLFSSAVMLEKTKQIYFSLL